jgi:hypothetical protein
MRQVDAWQFTLDEPHSFHTMNPSSYSQENESANRFASLTLDNCSWEEFGHEEEELPPVGPEAREGAEEAQIKTEREIHPPDMLGLGGMSLGDSPSNERPSKQDIISGRGSGANHNPGNIRFIELVRTVIETYLASTKGQKKEVAVSVVEMLHNEGRRFWEHKGETWRIMDCKQAVEKTSAAIRDQISKAGRHSADSSISGQGPPSPSNSFYLLERLSPTVSQSLLPIDANTSLYTIPHEIETLLPAAMPGFCWALCLVPLSGDMSDDETTSHSSIGVLASSSV